MSQEIIDFYRNNSINDTLDKFDLTLKRLYRLLGDNRKGFNSRSSALKYGVALNDLGDSVSRTKEYTIWKSMITRCYGNPKKSAYVDVTVCSEWLTYSSFLNWLKTQDWEGKELDKDLLSSNVKIYSPETCCMISKQLNLFINTATNSTGARKLGESRYMARVKDLFTGKSIYLGTYLTELEAHKAWLNKKQEYALLLANKETDTRVKEVLQDITKLFKIKEKK